MRAMIPGESPRRLARLAAGPGVFEVGCVGDGKIEPGGSETPEADVDEPGVQSSFSKLSVMLNTAYAPLGKVTTVVVDEPTGIGGDVVVLVEVATVLLEVLVV